MLIAIVVLLLAAAPPAAPPAAPDRDYLATSSGSPVQDKNFYLLTLLSRTAGLRAAVAADPALAAEAHARREAVRLADRNCAGVIACELDPFRYTDAQIEALGAALTTTLERTGELRPLVEGQLRPSGRFALYADLGDAALLRRAWADAARGIDRILRVYGLGEAPLYPKIDSISYAQTDKTWIEAVGDLVDVQLDASATGELFFDQPLAAALQLLAMNDRDEAARHEPLDLGENAAAHLYARTLDWSRWPYPAMLIPGRSPDLKDNPLSPEAKQRLRLAARRFREGVAPLIVVSGGYVNPSQTRFAEALQMKHALVEDGVPERAILVDPYARHTTTNFRNAGRLLFEIGAPLDRPILTTTTADQSRYIEAPGFQERCRRELGYACFSDLHRVSSFDTSLRLPLVSLQRDARDPLDP